MRASRILTVLVVVLIAVTSSARAQVAVPPEAREAAALVEELRTMPTSFPARAPSNGRVSPEETRLVAVYSRLCELGPSAANALAEALSDPEVRMRRGAALTLSTISATWGPRRTAPLDLRVSVPALIHALDDPDTSVRSSIALTIGHIGADAARAVPALVKLLSNDDVGSRYTACVALWRIGPAAKDALPALRKALSDPSADVRDLAGRAVERIESKK